MKLVKETSQELVLKERTGLNLFLLIWGLGFGGIPLIMLTIFFADLGVININCQRIEPTQVNCELNRSGFFGLVRRESRVLNNVTQARFEQIEDTDSEGDPTINNRVNIGTKQGQNFLIEDGIFVNGVKGNAQQMSRIESEINRFLSTNQPSLVLNVDNRWRWSNLFVFCFAGIFIIIGGSVFVWNIVTIGYEQIVFDKLTYKCDYKKVNLLGKKSESYSLRGITSIIIEQSIDSDGDKRYTLILPVANQKYTLDSGFHNLNGERIRQTAAKISNFLQVPVENVVK